jgi:hypothetical protein
MDGKASELQTKLPAFQGVQVYARNDDRGRPTKVSAIDEDDGKIRAIADRLQRAGYGVLRERNPRAGRVYHRLNATWVGPGEPPENPLVAG